MEVSVHGFSVMHLLYSYSDFLDYVASLSFTDKVAILCSQLFKVNALDKLCHDNLAIFLLDEV